MSLVPEFNKVTAVPLTWTKSDLVLPIRLIDSTTIENVAGTFKREHLDFWGDYLSKQDRADLSNTQVALVDRFSSTEHIGHKEEQSSQRLYWTFVALRLVKPTRMRYAQIQYKVIGSDEIDIFRISHPVVTPINTPESESLNRVTMKDVSTLREVLPRFTEVAQYGPEHLQRAIRYYEMCYSQIFDPVIQFLVWATGIEAVAPPERGFERRSELIGRIYELLDGSTRIYEESEMGEFQDMPNVSVRDVLPDIFKLRSRLAHGGGWPDWESRFVRTTLMREKLNYAAILREAAPFVLRRLIVSALLNAKSKP